MLLEPSGNTGPKGNMIWTLLSVQIKDIFLHISKEIIGIYPLVRCV